MREDQHVTMNLAIANCSSDLQVIGVNGRERMNAPYCFDIDLVSPDSTLDCTTLLHRDAYLRMEVVAGDTHGLHGQIQAAQRLYLGSALSLYRLRLMPALQKLAQTARRRTFNGLSVPQIISRMLQGHDMPDDRFRFEHLIGLYPPREHCVQYEESDLHLLRRLCEEEGISLRFEHHPDRHVMVFSDDPAGFPEWPASIRVDYLAERLSMRSCYSSQAGEQYIPQMSAWSLAAAHADNQPLWGQFTADGASGRREQLSGRQLERLRCERKEIIGRSSQPGLRCGHVIRVEGHPEALLNDQWLLTDIQHSGKQLAPLQGCASRDVIAILQAVSTIDLHLAEPTNTAMAGMDFDNLDLARYANAFQVIPWMMPFRPSVEHKKPRMAGTHLATQTSDEADPMGRVRIRYDWQATDVTNGGEDSWARVASNVAPHQAGTPLRIMFFEDDPDQPLVCATLDATDSATRLIDNVQVDGMDQAPVGPKMSLRENERLRIDSHAPLILRSARATLSITENGIHYAPMPCTAPNSSGTALDCKGLMHDLQLMHPADPAQPLAECIWYIVRMQTADLAQLPRINGDDILFEGKTDSQGWLGLSLQEFSRLRQLYRHPKNQLCVVHPGHCRTLRSCFQRALDPIPTAQIEQLRHGSGDDNDTV